MTTYFIDQKINLMANQYFIYIGDTKDATELIAFVHQKRLAMREKIIFFADRERSKELFTVQAREIIDFGAKYDVVADGKDKIGTIQKAFKSSLLRSTWNILGDNDEVLLTVQERSMPIAILRRIWDFIPVASEIPFPIRYHFDFIDQQGSVVAIFQKTTFLRDRYRLEVDEANSHQSDWRVFVAMGVMLDALQSR